MKSSADDSSCCKGPIYPTAFGRRSFIQVGMLGGLGITLADLFQFTAQAGVVRSTDGAFNKSEGPAKSVIQIILPAGLAHQESWDPKPEAPIEYRGPFGVAKTKLPGAQDGFPIATDTKTHIPKANGPVYGKPRSGVLSADFTPDGRVVTVGRDRVMHVFTIDGKSQSATRPLGGLLTKVAASYDGKLIVAGDYSGRIVLWDGRETQIVEPGGKTGAVTH
jgi:hypothetical protein